MLCEMATATAMNSRKDPTILGPDSYLPGDAVEWFAVPPDAGVVQAQVAVLIDPEFPVALFVARALRAAVTPG